MTDIFTELLNENVQQRKDLLWSKMNGLERIYLMCHWWNVLVDQNIEKKQLEWQARSWFFRYYHGRPTTLIAKMDMPEQGNTKLVREFISLEELNDQDG